MKAGLCVDLSAGNKIRVFIVQFVFQDDSFDLLSYLVRGVISFKTFFLLRFLPVLLLFEALLGGGFLKICFFKSKQKLKLNDQRAYVVPVVYSFLFVLVEVVTNSNKGE